MIHQREIESSADAAERAERHDAVASDGKAKPPWLPRFYGGFERDIKRLEPAERERLFCLMVLEIGRQRQLHELGLLEPILAERAEKRAAERATVR